MAKKMRIDKILANLGYGSRKSIKKAMKDGIVRVNGEIVTDSAMQIDPVADELELNGERVQYREFIYLMMNKEAGVVSATQDNFDVTVIDQLAEEDRAFEPFPVGRLDKDTEGLLLITNDGKLSHRLLSPKSKVDKEYYVELEQPVNMLMILRFEEGIYLEKEDMTTLPAKLEIIDDETKRHCRVTIQEGKFHQIKRMFHAVGNEVTYLKRIRMGNLYLDETLPLGAYRELTQKERESIGAVSQ